MTPIHHLLVVLSEDYNSLVCGRACLWSNVVSVTRTINRILLICFVLSSFVICYLSTGLMLKIFRDGRALSTRPAVLLVDFSKPGQFQSPYIQAYDGQLGQRAGPDEAQIVLQSWIPPLPESQSKQEQLLRLKGLKATVQIKNDQGELLFSQTIDEDYLQGEYIFPGTMTLGFVPSLPKGHHQLFVTIQSGFPPLAGIPQRIVVAYQGYCGTALLSVFHLFIIGVLLAGLGCFITYRMGSKWLSRVLAVTNK